jgi:hypothetical protein
VRARPYIGDGARDEMPRHGLLIPRAHRRLLEYRARKRGAYQRLVEQLYSDELAFMLRLLALLRDDLSAASTG